MKVKFNHSTTKIRTLIDAINRSIMSGKLAIGDNLPSINEASAFHNVSRDTVFKAYSQLKQAGVIDSTPQKGYFVKGDVNRVLLLLDNYSPFKKDLYHRLRDNLPENYKVDLIFHQYNESLFETIIHESIGKYNMFVVMNFSNEKFSKSLKKIPVNKLLLLDFGNFEKGQFSFICQDFDFALYNSLKEGLDVLKKYKKIIYVIPEDLRHPASSIIHFNRFCEDFGFSHELVRQNSDWKGLEAETVYLCILTEDLVKIIKEADANKLKIGSQIGLIAYNDDPVLEVIKDGISAISIDFGLMGEKAAAFIKTQTQIQEYLPTKFISRKSI